MLARRIATQPLVPLRIFESRLLTGANVLVLLRDQGRVGGRHLRPSMLKLELITLSYLMQLVRFTTAETYAAFTHWSCCKSTP